MYSGGEATKGKGLEACYALPGFDAAAIAKDFTISDVNGDGKTGSGEVWYKGEATKDAYQCYVQLAKVIDGFTSVFAQRTKIKFYGYDGKEEQIDASSLARITDSPYINSTFSNVRIDVAHFHGSYGVIVTAYKRGEGKAYTCQGEGASLDDAVINIVKVLEGDTCRAEKK